MVEKQQNTEIYPTQKKVLNEQQENICKPDYSSKSINQALQRK